MTLAPVRRRRLLLLVPFAPRLDGTHGGSRSIAQLILKLAERHTVALLAIRAPDDPAVDDALRQRCELVEEFVRHSEPSTGRERLSSRIRRLSALAQGRPIWVAEWHLPELARRANELARTWRPDLIQMEFHLMAQYQPALTSSRTPTILTEHDPGTLASRDRARLHRGAIRALYWLDGLAWKRFERRALSSVDAVVTFTERDRDEALRLRHDARVVRIPLATDIPPRSLDAVGSGPPSIVFVGNFMHPPNIDAAKRLVLNIFPLIKSAHPDSTLYIVGEGPPPELRALARERVTVTGRVTDVAPYLDSASVVAVPIRTGGGMRLKVIDALVAGKAIVASSRAVEGLGVVDGEHVLMAETDAEFADAIGRLLRDRELRSQLGRRARQWSCANLSWERSITGYEELYELLLEPRERPSERS